MPPPPCNDSVHQVNITASIGANGSGKSITLKAMARILRPHGGRCTWTSGHPQRAYKEGRSATGHPAQALETPERLRVSELVAYGRYPYETGFGNLTKEDKAMIAWALGVTGMVTFAERAVNSLSGGERQRAWIAMALAQGTKLLLLDEPTTFLDIGHQLEVLTLIQRLNRERQLTIVMVLHDLNHAAHYADRIVALTSGRIAAEGPPSAVFTEAMLAEVFDVRAYVIPHPGTGPLLCVPYASLGRGRAGGTSATVDASETGEACEASAPAATY